PAGRSSRPPRPSRWPSGTAQNAGRCGSDGTAATAPAGPIGLGGLWTGRGYAGGDERRTAGGLLRPRQDRGREVLDVGLQPRLLPRGPAVAGGRPEGRLRAAGLPA